MKDIEFSVSDIKDLMNNFSKNKLGSLKLAQGSFSIELESPKQMIISGAAATAADAPSLPLDMPEPVRGNIVKSPIVGTFYASSAPGGKPFVSPGQSVKKGDILFIIESMKLMNEVASELDGTVTEICVENGQVVEYGQPILTIE